LQNKSETRNSENSLAIQAEPPKLRVWEIVLSDRWHPAGIFSKGTPDSSLASIVNDKRAELEFGVP
jgi:hypothetical protein